MRNPFKRRTDQYPAITALSEEWNRRYAEAVESGDEAEIAAAGAARKSVHNWIVFASWDRFDPEIPRIAREQAEALAEFTRGLRRSLAASRGKAPYA